MKGLNPYMDQGVDTRYCSGAALFGSDYDIDSERLEEDIEFISKSIPAWRIRSGRLIAIEDMDTPHIKNCIKMIYRSNGTWRHQYLRYFETELRKRKYQEMEWYYQVYDTTGTLIKLFNTRKEALAFCAAMGRLDWTIK